MLSLIGVCLGIVCLVSLLKHHSRISILDRETNKLKSIIKELIDILKKEGIVIPENFISNNANNYSEIESNSMQTSVVETIQQQRDHKLKDEQTETVTKLEVEPVAEPSMGSVTGTLVGNITGEKIEILAESAIEHSIENISITPKAESSANFDESKTALSENIRPEVLPEIASKITSSMPLEEKTVEVATEFVKE